MHTPVGTRAADSGTVRLVCPSPEGGTHKNPRYLLVREDAARAERLPFRPRWDIAGAKATADFVIEANHISQLDVATLQNRLRDVSPPSPGSASASVISIPGSDFEARISTGVHITAGRLTKVVFTRKPGAVGESLGNLEQGANSVYQAVLRSVYPRRVNVTLVVYADSFDGFYTARNIAWNAGFDVDRIPKQVGERVEYWLASSSSSAISAPK